jgi:hypothetical protein
MSEYEQGSEPEVPQPFPKLVPKTERGNSMESESIEPQPFECPVPEPHVANFASCCEKFQRGEMSDLDVMDHVVKTLRELKK